LINTLSVFEKLKLANETAWSKKSYVEMMIVLKREKPDVCHVHNTFPLFSPSVFQACKDLKIPVLQTLHNYRHICTNGLFLRQGKVCEDCLGSSAYGAILQKCYRDSVIQTFAVARLIEKNKSRNTWNTLVDQFFCFSTFAKEKFIASGIEEQLLTVKPNFIPEFQFPASPASKDFYVYIGRLEENKGLKLLAEIAPKLGLPVKIIGSGVLSNELKSVKNLELLGQMSHDHTLKYLFNAKALLFPSLCYEGMPMTILEAFSTQTPVIASDLGAMKSMIDHRMNGLLFEPNSAQDLLEKVEMLDQNNDFQQQLASRAFSDFKEKYNEKAVYDLLINTYQQVLSK
ncbi:MAG: glycosyltransferase family 4 protein, partial [Salibacteraceae bacterium]|nr:glycosyltransferase family 4 protein [Salibacteraceae bacterium]